MENACVSAARVPHLQQRKRISRLFRKLVAATACFITFSKFPIDAVAEAPNARLANGEHTAVIGDLSFHYVVGGHGPLLVVQAPGWGIGSQYLGNGLAPLKKKFTLLTFDPRGSGASTHVASTDRLTNEDLADDLEHLRQYWGLTAMNVVGHSNGGAIAILYAERYPSRVRKLIVIGSQLLGYKGSKGSVQAAEDERRKKDPQFAYFLAHISDPTPKTDAEFTQYFKDRMGFYSYDPSTTVPAFLATMTNTMTASVNQAFIEGPPSSQAPPLTDLAKVRAKTLVIEGMQDPACPLDESERIQSGIAGSTIVKIDKSGHFPWIEQPVQFFSAVTQFLKD
jgi:proline iminopeptidase